MPRPTFLSVESLAAAFDDLEARLVRLEGPAPAPAAFLEHEPAVDPEAVPVAPAESV